MKLFDLLYELQANQIIIWKKDAENISFKFNKKVGFNEELKVRLKEHKVNLLKVLDFNDINSEESARKNTFYRVPPEFQDHKLTSIQQGIYLQSKLDKLKYTYNIPLFILLKEVTPEILKAAINHTIKKHSILRMSIGEDLKYKILDREEFVINEINISESEIYHVCQEKAKQEFNLSGGKLIHTEIIYINNSKSIILNFTLHHILADAYSTQVIIDEVISSYNSLLKGKNLLIDKAINYFDYLEYQKYQLQGAKYTKAIGILADKLNVSEPLDLSKSNHTELDNEAASFQFDLSSEIYSILQKLALDNQVSIYSILITSLYHVLSIFHLNQTNFPLGITVSNRPSELRQVIGPFISTLPLIFEYNPDELLINNIKKANDEILYLNEHQQINLDMLVRKSRKNYQEISNLMQVSFTMHNFRSNISQLPEIEYEHVSILEDTEKFGISIIAKERNEKIGFDISYAKNLYNTDYIKNIFASFKYILSNFNYQTILLPTLKVDLLSNSDYQKIIYDWNATDKEYPSNKTIHQLFEEQVEKAPENIALVFEDIKLTYQELNNRANQLAHYLQKNFDIQPDSLVALCLDRSEYMLIAILAVLKAGGAYVPMDPSYPDKRIAYILQDTASKIVLTNETHEQKLARISSTIVVSIDSRALQKQLYELSDINLLSDVQSNNLAYVIYTSGTTGNPKGVMIEHKGIVNYVQHIAEDFAFNANDRHLMIAEYIFDLGYTSLWGSILCGGELNILEKSIIFSPKKIIKYINKRNISVIKTTPLYFKALADYYKQNLLKILDNIKIILGGEKLTVDVLKALKEVSNAKYVKVFNHYGPTETTIGCITYKVNYKNTFHINPIIGKPISNIKCYVLSNNFTLLPIGAIGELYIGGVGLARGYLNNSELTTEKFIPNRFVTEKEKGAGKNLRLYKTGDLVRWLPDGNIEYIGRSDFQVKIRGYRIELGEIENALSSYSGVKQNVVLGKEHIINSAAYESNKYLVAYYVADNKLDEQAVIDHLSSKIPEYMVPNILVHLQELPLTINGKLDRKALPDPEFTSGNEYIPPRSQLEKQICQIWSELLGLPPEKMGIRDDFFKLGGDSIISIQLVSRIRKRLNINISVKDIFSHKNIQKLYDYILSSGLNTNNQAMLKTEQGTLSGIVALLPIQQWFFAHDFAVKHHWNQSFLIKTPNLHIAKLQVSVKKLLEHHDAFRLRYKKDLSSVSTYLQYYDENAQGLELKILDLQELGYEEDSKGFKDKLHEILTNWQSSFDLESGPIYTIGYIHGYRDGSSRIYFALHHLIVDTISWRILSNDLKNLYYGSKLGKKGSSYRQWVNAVEEYGKNNLQEKDYWANILTSYDNHKLSKLIEKDNACNYANLQLNAEITRKLLRDSNKAYHTQINDILLTALAYSLFEITGNKTNYIVLEGHGREEIDNAIDINSTIGWFTIIYPVRLELTDDVGETIKSIKESLRQIPNKGIGYGTLLGYQLKDLPKINFNYLGQLDQEDNKDDGLWHIIVEGSGTSRHYSNYDHKIININGMVIDEKLQFSIASKLNQNTTYILAVLFKQQLEKVINYTSSKTRSCLTISDVNSIISQKYLDQLQKNQEIERIYLANSLQQGFIYHNLKQGDIDEAYRIQIIWEYNNELAVDKLKTAWQYAQKKYPSLRLRFAWDEKLVQIIDKTGTLDWQYIDLSNESPKVQNTKIRQIQEEDRKLSYRLEQGNLFRVYLIKQTPELYCCILNNHHIILDGWSKRVLLNYIHDSYLKLLNQETIIETTDQTYQDAQEYIQNHSNDSKDYWHKKISQIEERSDLSGLLSSSVSKDRHIQISEYGHIINPQEKRLPITASLYKNLKELTQEAGITLNAVLQYAWHKVLNIYGNSNQTVVGTTVSGRNLPIDNMEESVGLYINTLPLIVNHQYHSNKKVIEIIKDIQRDINEINSRSEISLVSLHEGGQRLFDSLFVYENYPNFENKKQLTDININFKDIVEKLDYPLSVIAYENNNQLMFIIKYAAELFSDNTIEDLLSIIKRLLEQIVINPEQEVEKLNYLNQAQYQKIIVNWNATDKEYPSDKTIHQLFEQQVEKTPDNIAVVFEDRKLTYPQLNEQANQLAHYLQINFNIQPDNLVALCLDRSEHMLISILAVLKAGGAYVPIDPNYPDERISYILQDTASKIVLTDEISRKRLAAIHTSGPIISIDSTTTQEQSLNLPITNLQTNTRSNNLAYVIYTSGTTSSPKGVMIEHKAAINGIYWANTTYPLISSDKILQKTPYVFDVSVWELLWPSLYGATIVFAKPDAHKDSNYLMELIKKESITIINFVPSMLTVFIEAVRFTSNSLPSLRCIFCAGETLSLFQVKNCHQLLPNTLIYNIYGPTEAGYVLCYACNERDIQQVYIGKPIYNTTCYILDSYLIPLPIGAVGELYIGGVGVARGYLNRLELTAEKFIPNPFQTNEEKQLGKNARLYKTGDLVRWLPDGNIEYIGRSDFQVKIRGYRIELEEIENTLSSYPGVKQSVILSKENKSGDEAASNKYLVAYYVTENKLNEEDIISCLASKLPEYMVPNILVHLQELPLTINGKLDRKALPDPEFSSGKEYISPRSQLEKQICQIWAELLSLPEDKVGIRDDFFRLGGNSILAIRLVSKLNKEFNNTVNVLAIFKYKTIEKLSHYLKHNNENYLIIPKFEIATVEKQTLSFAQERLWFVDKYEGGTNAYNIPMVFKLIDTTNLNILVKSIESIVTRHEILRTLIKEDDEGHAYQVVMNLQTQPLKITKIEISDQLQLEQELKKEINYIYDLNSEYPIRVCLYELTDNKRKSSTEYYLSIVIHHITFDGWSVEIFYKELYEYYNYYNTQLKGIETRLELPELTIQYKDFAIWQRNYLQGEILETQLKYWQDQLTDYETLNLITDKARFSKIDYTGRNTYFTIDKDTSVSLRELAKELKVSLYSLLLSAYYLMLRSYSNQDDIVIGTPIANRHYPQIENLIGFFVNTLALRIKIDPKATIKEFIQQIGKKVNIAQLHQDLPFEKLVEELEIVRDTSKHPIFQVIFGVQSFGKTLSKDKLNKGVNNIRNILQSYDCRDNLYNIAKFDISTFIDDSEIQLRGNFNYAVSLYDQATINRFIETYKEILKHLSNLATNLQKQEQIKIENLNYLNQEQYRQIIVDWNSTDKEYPSDKTIHQLFEEQVEKTPDNIALVFEDIKLTYRELNNRANQLAYYLQENFNIQPDSLVVLYLDRSEHMLIAIFAVLKSGGAYVPIDPSYPDERISYMMQDTASKIVLTNEVHKQKLARISSAIVVPIDSRVLQEQLYELSDINLLSDVKSNNLAYVIYTSGTTGNPKGVMIEHTGVVNYIDNISYHNFIFSGDKVDFSTSIGFDLTITTTISALCLGAQVIVYGNLLQDLELYKEHLFKHNINIVKLIPSYLETLLNFLPTTEISKVILGGEKLSLTLIEKINYVYKGVRNKLLIIDEYGPTETTVGVHSKQISLGSSPKIGKLYHNLKVYIVNSNLIPLPIGAVGELYIGGVGVARGYLNRPELTTEKFIPNPFQTNEEKQLGKNARLYKTGDLVRWFPDGNMEYIGRSDFQVKIRGYRIELGEIENALSSYPEVKQNVVLAKEHKPSEEGSPGNKYLIAYYVAENKLDEETLTLYLGSKLPEYMVPNILMHLPELPLTVNGKLDRKALPDPEFISGNEYTPPRSKLEKNICHIWAELLGLPEEKVGIRDDFFKLGGDSIISIQLVSRLKQRLSLNISIKDIFSYKNIQTLYDNVINNSLDTTNQVELKTEQGILDGEVELLPIQQWFFANNFALKHHWNQSFLVRTPNLNIVKLQDSVKKLVEHHDAFRLRYKKYLGFVNGYNQYYDENAQDLELKILDIKKLGYKEDDKEFKDKLQELLTSWQSNFNLEKGPIYTIGYIHGYRDGSSRIYFALHHLITDAVSWRILTEDLRTIYYEENLGQKGSSYRQWVNAVKEYGKNYLQEKEYWHNILVDYIPDNKQLNKLIEKDNRGNYANLQLNAKTTKKLLRDSNKAYNNQINDILLTALAYSLFAITGNKTNHIVLEGHGREEIDKAIDINKTVGWFTTLYPIRLEISEELEQTIKNIKENLRQVPNKGIGYGALLGYQLKYLPKISFNYLGQFDQNDNKDNSEWCIAPEKSGISMHPTNYDPNILNINSRIIRGELQFTISSKLNQNTTTKLADIFKHKLEKVVDHCVNKDIPEYTMSDFKDFEPYVIFNKELSNNYQKLFIFPPGEGGAESYFKNIVPKLHNKTLILFNNYFLYVKDKLNLDYVNHITYEKLASEYICYIKTLQPQGPYHLLGWSFGGVLAFEIARQLLNANHTVANLILIDSLFNLKTAAKKTNSNLQTDSINYKYSPSVNREMGDTNIVLFKALQETDMNKISNNNNFVQEKNIERFNLFKYYANMTKCNHLDDILLNTEFTIKPISCSHYSWINNDLVIEEICNELTKY